MISSPPKEALQGGRNVYGTETCCGKMIGQENGCSKDAYFAVRQMSDRGSNEVTELTGLTLIFG